MDLDAIGAEAVEVARAQPMAGWVERWAAVNSGSRNLDGLSMVAGMLADEFAGLPGELRLVAADPVEAVDDAGRAQGVPHGASLHLTVRPDAPVQVLLTGHMDTVYGTDHPFQAVTTREPGVLQGPGVADMKGGLAVMLAGLRGLEASGAAARVGYEVVINADEEVGSGGSALLIARAARGKVAGLTYEPALSPEGTLAGARPGSGNFALVVRGRSAHAGRNPDEGRNALVAAADLALRLHRAVGPELKINPARISGGGPNNVVPDFALLRVNMRPADPADEARATALLETVAATVSSEHDVTVTTHGRFGRPPKPLSEGSERLLGLVRDTGAALGQAIDWLPSGGVCDGNNIAACGVPVVDTMGVLGGAIHSPDEYLLLDSLADRAALSALVLTRLAA